MEEKVLFDNYTEYVDLAEYALSKKKYNSATTLFFKAMAALMDLYILKKTGEIPSSHTKRFRIMQEKFPELYEIADRDFPFYQDSYTKTMDKEAAILLKEDVEKIKTLLEM